MKLKITREDIDSSIPSMRTEANPLSIAMLDYCGGFCVVSDDLTTITNTENGSVYKLDDEAKSVVQRFYDGKKVEPTEVELQFVDQNFYKQFTK